MIDRPELAALVSAMAYQTTLLHMMNARISSCPTHDGTHRRRSRTVIIPTLVAIGVAAVLFATGCAGTSGLGLELHFTLPPSTNAPPSN